MIKSWTTFFVYLLLATLPMQSIAAVSLPLIQANLQLQAQAAKDGMPCHDHMSMTAETNVSTETGKAACKDTCAAVCLALNNLSMALYNNVLPVMFPSATKLGSAELIYTSVIPANLFRPPISFS